MIRPTLFTMLSTLLMSFYLEFPPQHATQYDKTLILTELKIVVGYHLRREIDLVS